MASPKKFESLIQQGMELQKKGDIASAARHFSKALSLNPNHPQALWLAGMAELMLDRTDQGARHMERLVKVQPQSPDAHHALGKARESQNRLDEAETCYRRALGMAANHVPSLTGLGSVLVKREDHDAALEPLRRAVAIAPRAGEARYRLGVALYYADRVDDAFVELDAAVSLLPGDPKVLTVLAHGLVEQRRWQKAVAVGKRLTEMTPASPDAWSVLGTALMNSQKIDEAREAFEKGLALSPEHDGILSGLCNVYRVMGEFEKAYGLIEPLLKQAEPPLGAINDFATIAGSLGRTGEAARMVEAAIARESDEPTGLRALYFAAGELNDKAGDHDRAFDFYNKGNAATIGQKYVPEKWEEDFDAIMRVFGERGFPRLPHARHRIRRPILIVGMPRSGTSLLEQIVASHPSVGGAGESPEIMRMPARMVRMSASRTPYPDCVPELTSDDMDELVRDYDRSLAEVAPKAERVTDKMPHNFMYLGLINLLMPEARVIHIMRDPVDTCVSNYFQDFANPLLSYSRDLAHLGHHYKLYERLMAHWRTVLDMPFMEIRYEELVADQERVSREVIDFCGLEWDDACLQFHKTKRTVSTASYAQVRNPIYNQSVERWRRYEKHLGPLLDALGIQP